MKFALIEDGKGTQAVHDTVVAYQAAQRSGTASTKTMGEVAGSGKKPCGLRFIFTKDLLVVRLREQSTQRRGAVAPFQSLRLFS